MTGRHRLGGANVATAVVLPPSPEPEVMSAYAAAVARATDTVRRCGAARLDFTTAHPNGKELTAEALLHGLPPQVRLQAVAVFPDGHEVTGESRLITRDEYVDQVHLNLWCAAMADLVAKFEPEPAVTT